MQGTCLSQGVGGSPCAFLRFKNYIKMTLPRLTAALDEPVETYERLRLVELMCVYSLSRRLFKATLKPDKSLFKSMWDMQKK